MFYTVQSQSTGQAKQTFQVSYTISLKNSNFGAAHVTINKGYPEGDGNPSKQEVKLATSRKQPTMLKPNWIFTGYSEGIGGCQIYT